MTRACTNKNNNTPRKASRAPKGGRVPENSAVPLRAAPASNGQPRPLRKSQQREPHRKLEVQVGAVPQFIARCVKGVVSVKPYKAARWAKCEQQHKTNRTEYNAAKAQQRDYCADKWSFVVCSNTTHPIVAPHFVEECFDTHNKGTKWDRKFPKVGDVWSNIKMRMTLGNSSQPRAHLNFESVFAKLAQPFVQRKTGGKGEIWRQKSHAKKMEKVHEALEKAEKKLEKYDRKKMRALVDEAMVGGSASAAAGLPPFPAAFKKPLSLLAAGEKGDDDDEGADAMDDDDDDSSDDANGASDSDVSSVAESAMHCGDEDEHKENPPQETSDEDDEFVTAYAHAHAYVHANANKAAASPVPAAAAASPTEEHLPPSRNGSYGSFLHAGVPSSAQRLLDSPTKLYPHALASPVPAPQMDASSPSLSVSPLPILAFSPFGREETMAFSSQCRYSPIPA